MIYEVTASFSAFNPTTGATKEFNVGDKVTASQKVGTGALGSVNGLVSSDGFVLNPEYLKEVKTPVWIYVVSVIIIIIVMTLIFKLLKNN